LVLEKSITIDAPIEDEEGTKQVGFKKETMDKLAEVMDRTNIDFGTTQISVEKENMEDTEEDLFFVVKKAEVDAIQVDEEDEESTKVFVKEVTANWESKPVERFEKPIKVTYDVNEFGFAKATDAERKQLRVLVLDEETNQWESIGGIYDKKTGTITVYRIHASKYTMVKNKKSYSDVGNSWAKDEINNLLGKGISNPAKEFKPDDSLTREEFAAWISRAYGLKAKDVTEEFGDVDQSNPYYKEISNAFEQGLILGKGGDEFAPDEVITREEMATLIARAITNYNDVKIPNYGKEKFSTLVDSSETSEWAVANVMLMVDMGLMEPDENNEFNPDEPITKEAAAAIFDKLYN